MNSEQARPPALHPDTILLTASTPKMDALIRPSRWPLLLLTSCTAPTASLPEDAIRCVDYDSLLPLACNGRSPGTKPLTTEDYLCPGSTSNSAACISRSVMEFAASRGKLDPCPPRLVPLPSLLSYHQIRCGRSETPRPAPRRPSVAGNADKSEIRATSCQSCIYLQAAESC